MAPWYKWRMAANDRIRPPGRRHLGAALSVVALVATVVALRPAAVDAGTPALVVQVPIAATIDRAAPLPVPEPAPADAHASTPAVRHGLLEIPAIGLSQPFYEGVTLTAIDRGPSHWPGTAMPGEVGNVVVAGHRVTHSRPFYRLNELVPGDELIFTIDGQRFVYLLDRLEIVAPTDVHIIDQTHDRTATLFGCHPRGSARQRIVGHFRMAPETVPVIVPDLGGSARDLLAA